MKISDLCINAGESVEFKMSGDGYKLDVTRKNGDKQFTVRVSTVAFEDSEDIIEEMLNQLDRISNAPDEAVQNCTEGETCKQH